MELPLKKGPDMRFSPTIDSVAGMVRIRSPRPAQPKSKDFILTSICHLDRVIHATSPWYFHDQPNGKWQRAVMWARGSRAAINRAFRRCSCRVGRSCKPIFALCPGRGPWRSRAVLNFATPPGYSARRPCRGRMCWSGSRSSPPHPPNVSRGHRGLWIGPPAFRRTTGLGWPNRCFRRSAARISRSGGDASWRTRLGSPDASPIAARTRRWVPTMSGPPDRGIVGFDYGRGSCDPPCLSVLYSPRATPWRRIVGKQGSRGPMVSCILHFDLIGIFLSFPCAGVGTGKDL